MQLQAQSRTLWNILGMVWLWICDSEGTSSTIPYGQTAAALLLSQKDEKLVEIEKRDALSRDQSRVGTRYALCAMPFVDWLQG